MTMNELQNSFSVIYDEEKGKYFKVNNKTGQMQPSFKTGQLPAKFDPQVTGASYVSRKNKGNSLSHNNIKEIPTLTKEEKRKVQKLKVKANEIVSSHRQPKDFTQSAKRGYKSSLPLLALHSTEMMSSVRNSTQINEHSPNRPNNTNNRSSYFDTLAKLGHESNKLQSKSNEKIASFNAQLSRYADMEEGKLYQNNILDEKKRKRFIGGASNDESGLFPTVLDHGQSRSIVIPKPTRISMKSNHNKDFYEKELKNLKVEQASCLEALKKQTSNSKSLKASRYQSQNLSKQNSASAELEYKEMLKSSHQKQISEKKTFLQFHPEYIFRENERLINEQKDRKRNFKKLEKLFLEQNEKITSRIYRSNSKQSPEKSTHKKYDQRKLTSRMTEQSSAV